MEDGVKDIYISIATQEMKLFIVHVRNNNTGEFLDSGLEYVQLVLRLHQLILMKPTTKNKWIKKFWLTDVKQFLENIKVGLCQTNNVTYPFEEERIYS